MPNWRLKLQLVYDVWVDGMLVGSGVGVLPNAITEACCVLSVLCIRALLLLEPNLAPILCIASCMPFQGVQMQMRGFMIPRETNEGKTSRIVGFGSRSTGRNREL